MSLFAHLMIILMLIFVSHLYSIFISSPCKFTLFPSMAICQQPNTHSMKILMDVFSNYSSLLPNMVPTLC